MTPEATIAALHLLDRFTLTCMALQGQPWPAPPALPGRLHTCMDDPDPPGLPDWAHLPAAELARRLGVTRQAAHARLKKVRAQIVNHADQAEGSAPD